MINLGKTYAKLRIFPKISFFVNRASGYCLASVRGIKSTKSCLHILAEKGNYELTKILLDRVPSSTRRSRLLEATVLTELEAQRPRHLASIHLAALHGHKELVELFLDHGVDVNARNNKNDTPALWAARGNHVDTVRLLIRRTADLQLENDKGSTPLYWAVRYGFVELVRVLLDEGRADVGHRRKLGLVTPIVMASALGHTTIVRDLLDHGAEVGTTISHGMTALMAAASEGNDDVVELLVTRGGVDELDRIDASGNTALLHAARAGNVATMQILVGRGASVDVQNRLGETIWHHAIRRDDGDDFLRAVAALYRRAKRFDGRRTMKFADGRSPLQVGTFTSIYRYRRLNDTSTAQAQRLCSK